MLKNHLQRLSLNDELHARQPESLNPPEQASHLVLVCDVAMKPLEQECLASLCTRFGKVPPPIQGNHFCIDLGVFRVQWERHTEFSSYTFFRQGPFSSPFEKTVIESVPDDWLATLPGQVMMAAHMAIYPSPIKPCNTDELASVFNGHALTGAYVCEGAGVAFADLRIHADGFSRFLILDDTLTSRQAGRTVQRLFEIESYMMLALLAYPLARNTLPILANADVELADVTAAIAKASTEEEPQLLDKLTKLAATIEHTVSSTHYRITAASAYYELVQRRITDLREVRVEGLLMFREFCARRLTPARNTCETVLRFQESLSERVGRTSELLRTRVDISLEQQNHSILNVMAERARLQLRLQETVEGLSIAAITYYVVGLLSYLAKAAKALHMPVNPEIITGIAIPVVIISTAWGMRHIRQWLARRLSKSSAHPIK